MLILRDDAVSWTPTDNGDVVILDLRFSRYLTLNSSAALLWRLLADGCTEDALAQALQAEYPLDDVVAKRDVGAFLSALRERDLILE